ncbi:MAG: hypothetical protein M3521_14530 [Acidobacteriota bacterium]|nr:hypothetical protein [Acidobacteriota bacterium]
MTRTTLKDKIYGQMFWEEWDEGEAYWYAPMEGDGGERFELLIRADSALDFLTVAATHSTYKRLLENIKSIRDETVREVLKNSRSLFKKKRQRDSAAETINKNLRLFSTKIHQDLSAEINFAGQDEEEAEEVFYALIDADGNLTEAGLPEL